MSQHLCHNHVIWKLIAKTNSHGTAEHGFAGLSELLPIAYVIVSKSFELANLPLSRSPVIFCPEIYVCFLRLLFTSNAPHNRIIMETNTMNTDQKATKGTV